MNTAQKAKLPQKDNPMLYWIYKLLERRPSNVVAVAITAKQARMLWTIMIKQQNIVMA